MVQSPIEASLDAGVSLATDAEYGVALSLRTEDSVKSASIRRARHRHLTDQDGAGAQV